MLAKGDWLRCHLFPPSSPWWIATVSTRAVVSALYSHVPSNGSELVLFDVNRNIKSILLLRPASDTALAQILPPPPRRYKTTVISNAAPERSDAIANIFEAGGLTEYSEELGLYYPPDIFSLSHVALPFPPSDGLYGLDPDPSEHFGVSFGTIAKRGERGALIVSLDSLLRIASNPFFSYMLEKIAEGIGPCGFHPESLLRFSFPNVPPNPTESSATPPQPPQTPFGVHDDRIPERLSKPNPRLDDGSMSATMFLAPPRTVLRSKPIAQGSRNSSGCFRIAGFSVVAREKKLRPGCLGEIGLDRAL